MIKGGCYCGKIKYEISGDPISVVHCHCGNCKRSVGGPFTTWVVIKESSFSLTSGTLKTHLTEGRVTRGFCNNCGSSVSYNPLKSDTIDVTAGTLDDPDSVSPNKHIWDRKRVKWITMDDDLPHYSEWSQNAEPIE